MNITGTLVSGHGHIERSHRSWFLGIALLGALATIPPTTTAAAIPAAFEWTEAVPESQGLASARLDALWNDLQASQTTALLVVRNDRIVFERYADGWNASKPHYTASMAKAIVGGLAVAVALHDKRLTLDSQVATFVPAWKRDPRKSKITLRQLGSHTSGLADSTEEGVPKEKLPGWKALFWKRETPPRDPFTLSRDETPLLFDPGTSFQYSNPGIAMLSYTLTAALKDAPEKDIRTLLRNRVMQPIGVPDKEWSVGYGTTDVVDGLPLVASWGGGGYTPRALARVGRLMLREGDWDGVRLLSKEAVQEVTRDAGTPGPCGIGWWANDEGVHPKLPRDAFYASGAGHQITLVIPSLKLIAVRNGAAFKVDPDDLKAKSVSLFDPLMEAIVDR